MATFSVTERQTFMRCRRQWNYTSPSLQSLGPIVPRRSLSLGTTVHAALAQWLLEPDARLHELFLLAAAHERTKIMTAYKKRIGAEISDVELEPFLEGQELGTAMMSNYEQFWKQPLFEGFRIIEPEQKILVPVPGTSHNLSMRLDGLVERVSDGTLYILEHKTYSSRPKLHDLQCADQFLAYVWGAQQVLGTRIQGLAYDGMWSRKVPPRGSTMPDLFMRLLIDRPDFEVAEFGEILAEQLDEMADLVAVADNHYFDKKFYPNRRWQGCFDCGFDEVCELQSQGRDYRSYMRSHFVKLDGDKEMVADDD